RVCCGRRVDLMEKITPQLNLEHLKNGTLESPYWILRHAGKGEIDYAEQGLYLPRWLLEIEEMFPLQKPTLLGSNFSIHKKWLREVNGFDESFQSPGLGEDTDMERRLKPLGLEFKWIKHRAIQYHLWHPLTALGEQSRSMYAQRLLEGNRQAIQGLKELKMELRGHPTY
ncbi:MAG: hypothetical protein HY610_02240, partial [Elusimicrobia bacterium]|nr:hypothetical protein [Elusimicrobiota bacterium]